MKNRTIVAFGMLALLAVGAVAQEKVKVSGNIECGKPDQQQTIQIGDRPDHAYTISQSKCTWSKPLDFSGAQTKEAVFTNFAEANGERMQEHGFSVETLANGDNLHVRTQASSTMKDGKVTSEGKWTILRGTGKARGLKGGGTFKCSGTPEKIACDVQGEYEKAAAAPAKK